MSTYKDAFAVYDSSSEQCLLLAVELLERCDGIVLFNNFLALRPTINSILCEVIDPNPESHRCAEEFKVLVENARRDLENSKLGSLLSLKALKWRVIEDNGTETIELWSEP